MRVIDPGHTYELSTYDCPGLGRPQTLKFVKRNDPPEKYPGNTSAYPGTIMQEVFKALIDRLQYVNNQIPCAETEAILGLMQTSLFLLEERANRLHDRSLNLGSLDELVALPTCKECGHVQCAEEIDHPSLPPTTQRMESA